MVNKEHENANRNKQQQEGQSFSNRGGSNGSIPGSDDMAAMIIDVRAAIKAELKEEVKVEVKDEVKEEIKAELKKELGGFNLQRQQEGADDLRKRQKERGGYDSVEILESDKQNILQKVEK